MTISSSQALLRFFSLSKLPLNWMKKRQKWLFLDLNLIRYSILLYHLASNVANETYIITSFIKNFWPSKLALFSMQKRQNNYFRTWILFVFAKSFKILSLMRLIIISSLHPFLGIFWLSKLSLIWMKKLQNGDVRTWI